MEPAHRAAPAAGMTTSEASPREQRETPEANGAAGPPPTIVRLRLVAGCLLLAVLAFVQDPGRIVADTKLDLVVDPVGLMARALNLWEPLGFAGQVQNQGYGYLFPMGPFFALGELAGLPEWVVQRLWWTVLLCAAFVGVERLAAALGIGRPWTRLLAGLAYALAPRMMSALGPISSEVLPMALAPWVLLPLVRASSTFALGRHLSARRAGLLSGVAVLLVGGVNAVATAMVCVLPVIYLLTRAPGTARRRLMAWWAAGVALATLWWVVPLLILGRISPPFLDYIEDTSATTFGTSVSQVVRGADHWLAYVTSEGVPVWRSGWMLVAVPVVILYTVIVAAFGLTGLALRTLPERTWLVAGAIVGLLLVTAGHVGVIASPIAELQQSLLDGVLAPLRNVHKFDPILRLVLVLGLAHALDRLAVQSRQRAGWEAVTPAVAGLALLGIVGGAYPALLGVLAPAGSFAAIPGYWTQAADYLAEQYAKGRDDGSAGRTLIVPGASFGRYLWGAPRDEPLQAFGTSPWLVRDAIPLTPPATIRMLDALQQRMASGTAIPGLANQLAAAGVEYLLIRNDLDTAGGRAALPSIVHESLRGVEGLEFVADFGPIVGGQLDDGAVVDRGLGVPYRALEIYRVEPFTGLVGAAPLEEVPVISGGPEDVVALRDAGVLTAGPTVLDGERIADADGPLIAADGIARRELSPGRVDDNISARLSADDPTRLDRRVLDYQAFPDDRALAVAAWLDGVRITATSSAADADALGGTRRVAHPSSVADGDLSTAWWSSPGSAVGEGVEIAWDDPVTLGEIVIVTDPTVPGGEARSVRVTTPAGVVDADVDESGNAVVDLGGESTTSLAVEVTAVSGSDLVAGIREILGLPAIRRTLVAPEPSRPPELSVVSASADGRPTCIHAPSEVVCTDLLARAGEDDAGIDRRLDVGVGGLTDLAARVIPRSGPWLDEVIAAADEVDGHPMRAAASSSLVADPEGGPRAAIDRDLETAWIAAPDDESPTLVLAWGQERAIGGLELRQRLGLAASRPLSVRAEFADGTVQSGRFDRFGRVIFDEPVVSDTVRLTFPTVQRVFSVDPSVGGGIVLPVGISDLRVSGAAGLQPTPTSNPNVEVPCASGISVGVGSALVTMTADVRLRDLVQRLPVTMSPCRNDETASTSAADIPGGVQRVQALGADRWLVRSLAIGDVQVALDEGVIEPTAIDWGVVDRRVTLPDRDGQSLLVVRENISPAWTASLDGVALQSVRVDGWQQGWLVPAGSAGTVEISMPLNGVYRAGLALGAAAAIALVAGALVPSRRRPDEPVRARVLPPVLTTTGYVVALGLLGGFAGLVVGAAVVVLVRLVPSARRAAPTVAAVGVAVSGVALAIGPWGTASYAGEGLLANGAALMALAAALLPSGRPSSAGRADPDGAAPATASGAAGSDS